ncbi:MAG: hypothetical protein RI964_2114 [Pseudomonadota bacterium]|jgi:hypothetical protein
MRFIRVTQSYYFAGLCGSLRVNLNVLESASRFIPANPVSFLLMESCLEINYPTVLLSCTLRIDSGIPTSCVLPRAIDEQGLPHQLNLIIHVAHTYI